MSGENRWEAEVQHGGYVTRWYHAASREDFYDAARRSVQDAVRDLKGAVPDDAQRARRSGRRSSSMAWSHEHEVDGLSRPSKKTVAREHYMDPTHSHSHGDKNDPSTDTSSPSGA